jgi:hypothetical protein
MCFLLRCWCRICPSDKIVGVGSRSQAILDLLLACRCIGNGLVRCIIFAAGGDESRIRQLIDLERQDFRDVIVATEYDAVRLQRLRDFNRSFENAELS